MNSVITNQDKKQFISWYLCNNFILRSRSADDILTFIQQDESLLFNCRFVEDVDGTDRSLVINEEHVQYVDDKIITVDTDLIKERLKSFNNKPIYIEIDFPGILSSLLYINILEENHLAGSDIWVCDNIKKQTEKIINQSLKNFKEKGLFFLIDKALDENNKDEFIKLTNMLKKDLL